MNDHELLAALLAEAEETFATEGMLPLYSLAWSLRGIAPSVTTEQIDRVCHQAYDEFTRGHTVKLVWDVWPLRPGTAWTAEPGTPLEFDLDPERDVGEPMLVLVPA